MNKNQIAEKIKMDLERENIRIRENNYGRLCGILSREIRSAEFGNKPFTPKPKIKTPKLNPTSREFGVFLLPEGSYIKDGVVWKRENGKPILCGTVKEVFDEIWKR